MADSASVHAWRTCSGCAMEPTSCPFAVEGPSSLRGILLQPYWVRVRAGLPPAGTCRIVLSIDKRTV